MLAVENSGAAGFLGTNFSFDANPCYEGVPEVDTTTSSGESPHTFNMREEAFELVVAPSSSNGGDKKKSCMSKLQHILKDDPSPEKQSNAFNGQQNVSVLFMDNDESDWATFDNTPQTSSVKPIYTTNLASSNVENRQCLSHMSELLKIQRSQKEGQSTSARRVAITETLPFSDSNDSTGGAGAFELTPAASGSIRGSHDDDVQCLTKLSLLLRDQQLDGEPARKTDRSITRERRSQGLTVLEPFENKQTETPKRDSPNSSPDASPSSTKKSPKTSAVKSTATPVAPRPSLNEKKELLGKSGAVSVLEPLAKSSDEISVKYSTRSLVSRPNSAFPPLSEPPQDPVVIHQQDIPPEKGCFGSSDTPKSNRHYHQGSSLSVVEPQAMPSDQITSRYSKSRSSMPAFHQQSSIASSLTFDYQKQKQETKSTSKAGGNAVSLKRQLSRKVAKQEKNRNAGLVIHEPSQKPLKQIALEHSATKSCVSSIHPLPADGSNSLLAEEEKKEIEGGRTMDMPETPRRDNSIMALPPPIVQGYDVGQIVQESQVAAIDNTCWQTSFGNTRDMQNDLFVGLTILVPEDTPSMDDGKRSRARSSAGTPKSARESEMPNSRLPAHPLTTAATNCSMVSFMREDEGLFPMTRERSRSQSRSDVDSFRPNNSRSGKGEFDQDLSKTSSRRVRGRSTSRRSNTNSMGGSRMKRSATEPVGKSSDGKTARDASIEVTRKESSESSRKSRAPFNVVADWLGNDPAMVDMAASIFGPATKKPDEETKNNNSDNASISSFYSKSIAACYNKRPFTNRPDTDDDRSLASSI